MTRASRWPAPCSASVIQFARRDARRRRPLAVAAEPALVLRRRGHQHLDEARLRDAVLAVHLAADQEVDVAAAAGRRRRTPAISFGCGSLLGVLVHGGVDACSLRGRGRETSGPRRARFWSLIWPCCLASTVAQLLAHAARHRARVELGGRGGDGDAAAGRCAKCLDSNLQRRGQRRAAVEAERRRRWRRRRRGPCRSVRPTDQPVFLSASSAAASGWLVRLERRAGRLSNFTGAGLALGGIERRRGQRDARSAEVAVRPAAWAVASAATGRPGPRARRAVMPLLLGAGT